MQMKIPIFEYSPELAAKISL